MYKKESSYRTGPCFGRQLLWVMLSALLLLALGLLWVYRTQLQTGGLLREAQQRHRVQLAAAVIHQQLAEPFEDLAYLQGLRLFDDPDHPEFHPRLRQSFMDFMSREEGYHTVRWLDTDGRERVRVDGGGSSPQLVADGQLQNKARRYYFRESINREPGAVFVSPMDLNIERGEIEYPFRPVVRFATPVFDARGARIGVLVLNYEAHRLLERFREVGELSGTGELMLVNRQGYWLSSPDPAQQWGFMLDNDTRFASHYPEAWRRIEDGGRGQLETDGGLFTYQSVYPPARPPLKLASDYGLQWAVISRVPAEQIVAAEARQLQRLAIVGLSLMLLLLLGGAWLARVRAAACRR